MTNVIMIPGKGKTMLLNQVRITNIECPAPKSISVKVRDQYIVKNGVSKKNRLVNKHAKLIIQVTPVISGGAIEINFPGNGIKIEETEEIFFTVKRRQPDTKFFVATAGIEF